MTDHKRKYFLLVFAGVILGCSPVAAGRIVYPWRACPAVVLTGQHMEILYDSMHDLPVDSVILEGPFNRVALFIDTVSTGKFEYDPMTHSATNSRIKVKIPENTPEELYDLMVKSAGETGLSEKSVNVLKAYRNPHCFIHISDPHISRQWVGTADNGYAKELELLDRFIEVANIIHPDYVIVTGDLIHDYTRMNADSIGWGGTVISGSEQHPLAEEKYKNYFEGTHGFSGIYGLNAPVFSLPGNHDFYGLEKDDHHGKVAQWNQLMGKRVYGFSYADTRIIVADDYLGDPVTDIPDKAPMSGLQGAVLEHFFDVFGHGKVRIMAQHRPDRIDTAFINRHHINILLNGHSHTPRQSYVGTTPTLSIRPGTVCRSGEIAQWTKTLGFFRIFRVDGDTFHHSPPLRFCENPTAPCNELIMNLTLVFTNANTGQSTENEAVITNNFAVDLPACRVRFVMARGKYRVFGGTVRQVMETERCSVIDVDMDVNARSVQRVRITQ
ncbi:MAG: metallophosphoesterase [Bacteroidales bacterium]|nr:metallophosphoesterase [Bacteroidales bacterium]